MTPVRPGCWAAKWRRWRGGRGGSSWLNPLKANPGYAPLARGMREALPHVDLFAPGHDLASLDAALVRVMEVLS